MVIMPKMDTQKDKPILNLWKKKYTEIKENEELCSLCKGVGGTYKTSGYPSGKKKELELLSIKRCKECCGEGKIDWISRLTNNRTLTIERVYTRFKTGEFLTCIFNSYTNKWEDIKYMPEQK